MIYVTLLPPAQSVLNYCHPFHLATVSEAKYGQRHIVQDLTLQGHLKILKDFCLCDNVKAV
jgi:hypothetical protein